MQKALRAPAFAQTAGRELETQTTKDDLPFPVTKSPPALAERVSGETAGQSEALL